MPLMCIQYSEHLPNKQKIKSFVVEAHEYIASLVNTELNSFKTRIVPVAEFIVGDGKTDEQRAVLFVDFRMLPGRTDEVKKQVGDYLLQKAQAAFQEGITRIQVHIQVQVGQLDAPNYHKND
ncbi:5-carboxymethyl-2-hydroxymuconate Delta-isomerase [Neisseria sp. Ec49-e6-T10]|uniref:5-carboxymethyl-2-hydroxymuconate Delta-isomerase n=1 Tax=Neisseria sp. Ec49-e6-T10 TaxID=3140744 RepID=UPI003EBFA976